MKYFCRNATFSRVPNTSLSLYFHSLFILVIILNLDKQILAKPISNLRLLSNMYDVVFCFQNLCSKTWANWNKLVPKFSKGFVRFSLESVHWYTDHFESALCKSGIVIVMFFLGLHCLSLFSLYIYIYIYIYINNTVTRQICA